MTQTVVDKQQPQCGHSSVSPHSARSAVVRHTHGVLGRRDVLPNMLCLLRETNQPFSLSNLFAEFFAELSTAVCPLALTSSMTEMVHYTRQGLHWLRLNSSTP